MITTFKQITTFSVALNRCLIALHALRDMQARAGSSNEMREYSPWRATGDHFLHAEAGTRQCDHFRTNLTGTTMTDFCAFVQLAIEMCIADSFTNAAPSATFSVASVFATVDRFGAFEATGENIGGTDHSLVLYLAALACLDRSFSAFTASAFVASENALVIARAQLLITSQAARLRNLLVARLLNLRFSAEAIAWLRARADAAWLAGIVAHLLATVMTAGQQNTTLLLAGECRLRAYSLLFHLFASARKFALERAGPTGALVTGIDARVLACVVSSRTGVETGPMLLRTEFHFRFFPAVAWRGFH